MIFAHAFHMIQVDAVDAADRDADGVHRDRIIGRDRFQKLHRMRIGEEILRVDFEPAHGRAGGRDLGEVREAQTDTGGGASPSGYVFT